MSRSIEILSVNPVHPGPGKPSRIEMAVALDYLKDRPIEFIVISPRDAISLIEQLARAVRVTT